MRLIALFKIVDGRLVIAQRFEYLTSTQRCFSHFSFKIRILEEETML